MDVSDESQHWISSGEERNRVYTLPVGAATRGRRTKVAEARSMAEVRSVSFARGSPLDWFVISRLFPLTLTLMSRGTTWPYRHRS
jgi:hypothetical protein